MIRRLIKSLFILLLILSCEEVLQELADTTSPTVVITYPVGGSTLTETATVTVDVADDGDLISVKFLVDGAEVSVDSLAPYQYEWDVCVQATGNHTIIAKAEDSAGNQGQSDLLTFTINASYDCATVCGGDKLLDNCEVCDADTTNDCVQDCDGVWGGTKVIDNCGVCGGDNSDCTDCLGEIGGIATMDNCGTCDSDSSNDCLQDCDGTWGGNLVDDECGVCGGDNTTCIYFTPHVIHEVATGARDVYAIDLDIDGDMDVLSAAVSEALIFWYENDGAGSFTSHMIYDHETTAHSVYAADIDDDGDIDVLSGTQYKMSLHLNDGNEIFQTEHVISTNSTPHSPLRPVSIHAADIDGDGNTDLVSATLYDYKISWWENDGSDTLNFTRHVIHTHSEYAKSVYVADVDGDGDTDVLSTSDDTMIIWYENDGSGNFSKHLIGEGTEYPPQSVHATDIDGDSDVDVAVVLYQDKIMLYKNDGSENFDAITVTIPGPGAKYLYIADIDEDGEKDIVISTNDNVIFWLQNDGEENFTAHVVYSEILGSSKIYVEDVDGDGDLDILSASYWDNKIMWYENSKY